MEHAIGKSAGKVHQNSTGSFFHAVGTPSFFGDRGNSFFAPAVKTKLAVSSPGDPQEKEADMVADKVMRRMDKTTGL